MSLIAYGVPHPFSHPLSQDKITCFYLFKKNNMFLVAINLLKIMLQEMIF
jgi:hypothetical protein